MALDFFRNTYAGAPLDRAGDRRSDTDWLRRQLDASTARGVAFWNGRPLVSRDETGLLEPVWLPAGLVDELAGGVERLLFLGLLDDEPLFAVDLEGPADPADGALLGFGQFEDLRRIGLELAPPDAAVLAVAKGVFEWRRRHRYCAACGQPSHPADGGWKRVCETCKTEHFPRTDPVVIMLPFHGDRCMLGRQAMWAPGMFSALAGFMEPGEFIEEACARELLEESGLHAVKVHYHSSQPWPWPSSLMIGLLAEVEDEEGQPDQTELEEIRWFTRAEARDLLAGKLEGLFAPNPAAIAHQLLKSWAGEG